MCEVNKRIGGVRNFSHLRDLRVRNAKNREMWEELLLAEEGGL